VKVAFAGKGKIAALALAGLFTVGAVGCSSPSRRQHTTAAVRRLRATVSILALTPEGRRVARRRAVTLKVPRGSRRPDSSRRPLRYEER
jgi:hypothetical protein